MTIRMDQLVRAVAAALDIVEGELLGASTHHGKRIALLALAMGRSLGMDAPSLSALAVCALLHDSALTEYILAERKQHDPAMKLHCLAGQRNAEALLFNADIAGFVLCHHERADGLGPFGKREGEFPRGAALIAIADMVDVACHLQRVSPERLAVIRQGIGREAGNQFTREAAGAMLDILDEEMLLSLRDDRIIDTVQEGVPQWITDIEDQRIFRIADLSARIIDYKSVFTKDHSEGIANRAWLMGEYYGYTGSRRMELYLAAALHDIGKLATPTAILEKPGRLTDEEFSVIKDHARQTYELLRGITGFESICNTASRHHEKLDGSGYPFGLKAGQLTFNDRLLAGIDIYQAVNEARPYHGKRSHKETMPILYAMADEGALDGTVVRDLDRVMAEFSDREIPPPEEARPEEARGIAASEREA
ncbi:MAG: HD domain-containing protein [Treponema sp.]|nr:HD domain-containing protein [Treponema sp.]